MPSDARTEVEGLLGACPWVSASVCPQALGLLALPPPPLWCLLAWTLTQGQSLSAAWCSPAARRAHREGLGGGGGGNIHT